MHAVKKFLRRVDVVSVVKFVYTCLDKVSLCAAGLSNDSQTSN